MTTINLERQQESSIAWLMIFCFIAGFSAALLWRPPVLTHRLILDQPVAAECAFDLEIGTVICPGRVPGEGE